MIILVAAVPGLTHFCIVFPGGALHSSNRKASPALEESRGLAKVAVSPNECMFRDWPLTAFAPVPRRAIVGKRIGRQRGSAMERLRQLTPAYSNTELGEKQLSLGRVLIFCDGVGSWLQKSIRYQPVKGLPFICFQIVPSYHCN